MAATGVARATTAPAILPSLIPKVSKALPTDILDVAISPNGSKMLSKAKI